MTDAVNETPQEPKNLFDKPEVESQEPSDDKASANESDDKSRYEIVSEAQLQADEDESSEQIDTNVKEVLQNTPRHKREIFEELLSKILTESKQVKTSDDDEKAQVEPRHHKVNDELKFTKTLLNKLQGAEKQVTESLEKVKSNQKKHFDELTKLTKNSANEAE